MKRSRTGLAAVAAILSITAASVARGDETAERIDRMERELQDLKRQVQEDAPGRERESEHEKGSTQERLSGAYQEILDRVKLGGYGSMRFESSDLSEQKNSFVFRRLVLTADANIAPRLKSYVELEFERFRELELEKSLEPTEGGLKGEQAVEGTDESEIALEQAYLQYDIKEWLKLRAGGLLVPLGRFNVNHDDNRWDLPRRSLIDRGVPVLPSTAAWAEVGAGFTGDFTLSDDATANYEVYVMNGVSLDSEIELIGQTRDPKRDKLVYEVELSPSTGGFAGDVKDSKAVAGRLTLSPALGHEIAGSWYYGQYTPDFLGNEDLWAVGVDGRSGWGPFEIEGEAILSRFDGTRSVAESLAGTAVNQAGESADPSLETEVEFELANLARTKYGYWLDLRYRFWPAFLKDTVLGEHFDNPQFVAVVRGEQAWIDDLIQAADFTGGTLTSFETENRRVDRISAGLAYRPVPLVVFQLAYEYTQTNRGQSLAGVTNFLAAGPDEDTANTVMIGTAFGF